MRWEYVDRSVFEFHGLWVMNPDGTNQMTFYGNMHPDDLFIDAKPIPGARGHVQRLERPFQGIRVLRGELEGVHRPDGFSFASELAALLEDDDVSAEVNATAIHHYLTLHYVPSPETAFKGVSKLPPAHTLTLRDGKLSTERYWRNSFEPKHAASVGELAEEAWDLIASATKLRMVSDVPLGAFLSV